jgi:hypothetical protein
MTLLQPHQRPFLNILCQPPRLAGCKEPFGFVIGKRPDHCPIAI